MTSICYYVSGHGFGHATRASQVIQALLEDPYTTITVCTLAPSHLFPKSPRLKYRKREVDSTIIQPSPYEIDITSTFLALESFIQKLFPASETTDDGWIDLASKTWLEQETEFLDENGFDIVIADAPWSIGLLNPQKKKKPIKILLTNFTFDLIFHSLYTKNLPPTTSLETAAKYLKYCEQVKKGYISFDYLIRLPGFIDFPFLKEKGCKTNIIDVPLVYRMPEKRSKSEILEELNIPREYWGYKILLVQFGGHEFSNSSDSLPPKLPPGWICLSPSPSTSSQPATNNIFFTFPLQIYLPDLISITTAVLGKIGYGTVSECVGMGKPLIYVRREMFAEEEYLLRYLGEKGVGMEIGREEFEMGEWMGCIERVVELREGRELGCEDGSAMVAKQVHLLACSRSVMENGNEGL